MKEFLFKTIGNLTSGVIINDGEKEISPEDFGFFPIPVNEQKFSVQIYDQNEAPEYSDIPKIVLDNIKTYIKNDSLNISFDFRVEKGAVAFYYYIRESENRIFGSGIMDFEIVQKNSFMEYSGYSLGHQLDVDNRIYFEGDTLHFHFRLEEFFKEHHWKVDTPYILCVWWYDSYNPSYSYPGGNPIFTHEYILSSSKINHVIEDESNIPIEIFNLNGIKVPETINNLKPGIYLIKQGQKINKIIIGNR